MSQCSQRVPARRYVALGEIASVRIGLAFRARIEPDPGGNIRVVQAKEIRDDGAVDWRAAISIAEKRVKPDYLLRGGDIVFQPKGAALRAGLVGEDVTDTIAAAPLQIIRPTTQRVLPAFLVVVLNMPTTTAGLLQQARGSHVPQVSSAVVKDIRVPLPDLDRQASVVALANLMEAERRTSHEIAALRIRLLEAVVAESARNTQRHAKTPG